jgi:hypothetical protein
MAMDALSQLLCTQTSQFDFLTQMDASYFSQNFCFNADTENDEFNEISPASNSDSSSFLEQQRTSEQSAAQPEDETLKTDQEIVEQSNHIRNLDHILQRFWDFMACHKGNPPNVQVNSGKKIKIQKIENWVDYVLFFSNEVDGLPVHIASRTVINTDQLPPTSFFFGKVLILTLKNIPICSC